MDSKSRHRHRATRPKDPPRRFAAVPATEIEDARVDWLWEPFIPRAKLGAWAGEEGVGKGTLMAGVAAQATNGWLRGDCEGQPLNVLILCGEDSAGDTIKPRLRAAKADLARVFFFTPTRVEHSFSITEDIAQLQTVIEDKSIDLVFIDPLSEYVGAEVDTHKETDVRRALRLLGSVAEETGATIIPIYHLNKRDEGKLRARVSGSHALMAVPRIVLLLSADVDGHGTDSRLLSVQKSNLGVHPRPQRFRIVGKPVKLPGDLGRVDVPCAIEFESADDVQSSDVLSPSSNRAGAPKRDLARAILKVALGDGQSHPVRDVKALGEGIGRTTWERARRDLGVVATTDHEQPPRWYWRLPPSRLTTDGATDDGATGKTHGKPPQRAQNRAERRSRAAQPSRRNEATGRPTIRSKRP